MIVTDLEAAIGSALGSDVVGSTPISGGDTAAAFRVGLADGRTVFAKTHASPPSGFFGREASDLAWLADSATLPVPDALVACDDQPAFLALSWIEPGAARATTDAAFGVGLARLHLAGADCFGRTDRRTTGSLALPNDPVGTWAEFYAHCRLLPLARIAAERRSLPTASIQRIERLASRLADVGGPVEPPARLHGDLWAGNRMVDVDGVSWLIDPACHGGQREFDLAMMRLFGGFDEDAFVAYEDVFPLADGWEARIPLHQLAPLIVHAVKFGGGYVGAVERALDKLGRGGGLTHSTPLGPQRPVNTGVRFSTNAAAASR